MPDPILPSLPVQMFFPVCTHLSSFFPSSAPMGDEAQLVIPGKSSQCFHCSVLNTIRIKIRPLDLGSGDGEGIKTEWRKDVRGK